MDREPPKANLAASRKPKGTYCREKRIAQIDDMLIRNQLRFVAMRKSTVNALRSRNVLEETMGRLIGNRCLWHERLHILNNSRRDLLEMRSTICHSVGQLIGVDLAGKCNLPIMHYIDDMHRSNIASMDQVVREIFETIRSTEIFKKRMATTQEHLARLFTEMKREKMLRLSLLSTRERLLKEMDEEHRRS